MPTFEPSFGVHPLQQLGPGAFVIFQRAGAFVGLNRSAQAAAPRVPVTLAVHDPQRHTFVYRYFDGAQPNVLVPTGGIIIMPNLLSLTDNAPIQPASDKLFLQGEDRYVVVQIPTSGDIRLLSLANGSLVTPTVANMDAFDSWAVGVESMGEFVPLLRI